MRAHLGRWTNWGLAINIMICLTLFTPISGEADKRVALLIGNSAYQNTTELKNPINDATNLSEAFSRLGFKIFPYTNVTKSNMEKYVQIFSQQLQDVDIGVFFYAGHSIQINSNNFLIPVDFDPLKRSYLRSQLVSLDNILHEMEKSQHTIIIFLDACRNNPFAEQIATNKDRSPLMNLDKNHGIEDVRQGLGEVQGKADTLIAYATNPGNIAFDGGGTNSPFTEALLNYLEEPGMELIDIMRNVVFRVKKKTKEKQIPWYHSSLSKKVFFKMKNGKEPIVIPPP